jgi:hypothetical protein
VCDADCRQQLKPGQEGGPVSGKSVSITDTSLASQQPRALGHPSSYNMKHASKMHQLSISWNSPGLLAVSAVFCDTDAHFQAPMPLRRMHHAKGSSPLQQHSATELN